MELKLPVTEASQERAVSIGGRGTSLLTCFQRGVCGLSIFSSFLWVLSKFNPFFIEARLPSNVYA